MTGPEPGPELMTPQQVGREFMVDPRTVNRWRHTGKLMFIETPTGHHRYFRIQVNAMLQGRDLTPAEAEAIRQAGGRSS